MKDNGRKSGARSDGLHTSMSVEEFDGGYFYATEIKAFARR